MQSQDIYRVFPLADGKWKVESDKGDSVHLRKALAGLFANQAAAKSDRPAIVIFYKSDGRIEIENKFDPPAVRHQ